MNDFPLDSWLTEMKEAVDRIAQLGRSLLTTHRQASNEAAANADRWQLAERLEEEGQALLALFDSVCYVARSMHGCIATLHTGDTSQSEIHDTIGSCADVIEENLPRIENAILTSRHAALDLLQWAQRSGRIDDSTLPGKYRESYARLISHAPIIKPLTESLQQDLLLVKKGDGLPPVAQRLISSLSRYNAVIDSARALVRSIVEPPLELVFHETESFLEDTKSLSTVELTSLATELNDCCQLLLYDVPEFNRRVRHVRPQLPKGVDASMAVLGVSGGYHAIFTVDEDPVFEQLSIMLLRVLPEHEIEAATNELAQALYGHFSSE